MSAKEQITACSNAMCQWFYTREEAQKYLDDGGIGYTEEESNIEETEDRNELPQKRLKKSIFSVGAQNNDKNLNIVNTNLDSHDTSIGLPLDAEDGFDPNIFLDPNSGHVTIKTAAQNGATKLQAIGPVEESDLRIYTDGSSLRNGQLGALAGIGVYFGPCDPR